MDGWMGLLLRGSAAAAAAATRTAAHAEAIILTIVNGSREDLKDISLSCRIGGDGAGT
jgi:hypothetical protein